MVKLSDIELPMIFKDRLLFSYGMLNNWNILPEEIVKSVYNTKWEDQRNRSLFFAHTNRDAQKWIGRIENPHVVNGELYGDLEIHDADLALKLGPGKAPIGVSAEIRWPKQFSQPQDFTYRGFAMVPNPEVQDTMVNFSKENDGDFNTATMYVPYKEVSINFSEAVVENNTEASLNNQTETIAEFNENEIESNLKSAERRLNNLKMEEKQNNVEPEVKEEVVEEIKEVKDDKEESKESYAEFANRLETLSAKVEAMEAKIALFSKESEKEEEKKVEEPIEEVKVEEVKEVVEEVKEEPKKVESDEKEESIEADFSQILADKMDRLIELAEKRVAAPMSTAEFGAIGKDKQNDVIDRLTLELSK
jgi:hypothetical protein